MNDKFKKTVDLINYLELENIPKESIEKACSSDFVVFDKNWDGFPSDVHHILSKLNKELKKLQLIEHESIWNLCPNYFEIKSLQTFFCTVIRRGSTFSSSYCKKVAALEASHAYILLIQETGSILNGFLNLSLFDACLELLKVLSSIKVSNNKKKPTSKSASQSAVVFEDSDEEDNSNVTLTSQNMLTLLDIIHNIIKDLNNLLNDISLKSLIEEITECTIEPLTNILKSFNTISVDQIDFESNTESVCIEASILGCLYNIVKMSDEKREEICKEVLESLLQSVTDQLEEVNSTTIPRDIQTKYSNIFLFASVLYKKYGDEVSTTFIHILQNALLVSEERACHRTLMTNSVQKFLSILPYNLQNDFLTWLNCLLSSDMTSKICHGLCLSEAVINSDIFKTDDQQLLERCDDLIKSISECFICVSTSIRIRSLLVFASILEKGNLPNKQIMQIFKKSETLKNGLNLLSNGESDRSCRLSQILCIFCTEISINVRKAAIRSLGAAICCYLLKPTKMILKTIQNNILHHSVSCRKLTIDVITNILKTNCDNREVQKFWMKCVLPSIHDVENSVEQKAKQMLDVIILENFYNQNQSVWNLLKILTLKKNYKYREHFKKLIGIWVKEKSLDDRFVSRLDDKMKETEYKEICWLILRCLSCVKESKDAAILACKYFVDDSDHKFKENNIIFKVDVFLSINQLVNKISEDKTLKIIDHLKEKISNFQIPTSYLPFAIETVVSLEYSRPGNKEDADIRLEEWYHPLRSQSESWLKDKFFKEQDDLCQNQMINYLHLSSCLIQRSFKNSSKTLISYIQGILTDSNRVISASQESVPLSQFHENGVPDQIRAEAIIALGRICLVSERIAKKCVHAFANQLEKSDSVACTINSLQVLCDLTLSSANITDGYINQMSTCLGDENLYVQKQCLLSITDLLKKEFIKWSPKLVFKFLFCATCSKPTIVKLTKHCLMEILRDEKRMSKFYYEYFISALFYFNNYKQEEHRRSRHSQKEKRIFSLHKEDQEEDRMKIYQFMLENMMTVNRINLAGRLASDILEPVITERIVHNDESFGLIKDALCVLSCKEMKFNVKNDNEEEENENDGNSTQQPKSNIKKKIILLLFMRKTLEENIIPIIIKFSKFLREIKSPLNRFVRIYFKEMLSEYPNEVEQLLAADRDLAREIDFEMKQLEVDERRTLSKSISIVESV